MKSAAAAPVLAQRRLVQALADAVGAVGSTARPVEIVETHISLVLLAGQDAYKIKKPLDLGFLDFSTLEKRRLACMEEVRLNRRTAPDIYRDVVAITGTAGAPVIGGPGPVLEYAVRMHRFAREDGLDFLLDRGALRRADIVDVAHMITAFHAGAAQSLPGQHGTAARARADALANFSQMPTSGLDGETLARLDALRDWTAAEQARHAALMDARAAGGWVRECHGDLHLANMVRHGGRITAFDCIEFNPEMRWIDVVNDLAFTLMDLRHRGRADFARLLLCTWMDIAGDRDGIALLPFYLAYRAMVRAKVAAIRAGGAGDGTPARQAAWRDFHAHLQLAEAFSHPGRPHLIITSGFSGSGKSHLTSALLEARDCIRLRADVERKRLAGLAAGERSGSAPGRGLYSAQATAQVYAHLGGLADRLLGAGNVVIVDATFLKRAQRDAFRQLAARRGVPFTILRLDTARAELERRIVARNASGEDASEADLAVLAAQLAGAEPCGADEAGDLLSIDGARPPDLAAITAALDARGHAAGAAAGDAPSGPAAPTAPSVGA